MRRTRWMTRWRPSWRQPSAATCDPPPHPPLHLPDVLAEQFTTPPASTLDPNTNVDFDLQQWGCPLHICCGSQPHYAKHTDCGTRLRLQTACAFRLRNSCLHGVAQDPLAAYDVSVAEEGLALEEYLTLVKTAVEQTGA